MHGHRRETCVKRGAMRKDTWRMPRARERACIAWERDGKRWLAVRGCESDGTRGDTLRGRDAAEGRDQRRLPDGKNASDSVDGI